MKPNFVYSWRASAALLVLGFGLIHNCQGQATNTPRTYFEMFDAATEVVLVKGMVSMGVLNSQIGYPVEIRAEEIKVLRSTNAFYAVAVRTTLGEHKVQTDYIDYDELAGFISAVSSIKQADRSVSQLENYDIVFRTRSGLSLNKSTRGSKVTIFLKSIDPEEVRNVMEAHILDSFGAYLSAAKARLDLIRVSP